MKAKALKKLLMTVTLVFVMGTFVACGTGDNNNGTDNNAATEQNATDNNTGDTENNNTANDNVVDLSLIHI